jgi:hypothetical protein
MTGPRTTGSGMRSQEPSTSNATSNAAEAQINQALRFLRQLPAPDGLHERVEERLTAARLNATRFNVVRISKSPLSADRWNAESGHSASWFRFRIAACAVAVTAASLGLVADRATGVRAMPSMPAAVVRVPHSGLEAAAAVRVPTHTVGADKLLTGRSGRPLGSGRNTIEQRTVLPKGVAVPHHPAAERDTTAVASNPVH